MRSLILTYKPQIYLLWGESDLPVMSALSELMALIAPILTLSGLNLFAGNKM